MKITIALCTRNNCANLLRTLESLRALRVDCPAEVLVIDNGSADGTWDALRGYSHPTLTVRRVIEERRGLCHARNRALAESDGDIIAFTDDDVRVSPNWIHSLTRPLLDGGAEAVVGGITIAPHLLRPWMTPMHRAWFASTEALDPARPAYLIGANMAFLRTITRQVPEFDVELDPGRLGGWGDTLFSWQVREAGYRLKGAFDHAIEHHFDESRLSRSRLLDAARVQGRCHAYVLHHWQHGVRPAPVRNCLRHLLSLTKLRLSRLSRQAEGVPEPELIHVAQIHIERQWMIESRRPRNYERRGLKRVIHP
jgi:glycosyltransferase involved in cell wall biosynthesis